MFLLDIPDDSVREGVAAALGNVGRRADVAIPKLKELLPELDCRIVVRRALTWRKSPGLP